MGRVSEERPAEEGDGGVAKEDGAGAQEPGPREEAIQRPEGTALSIPAEEQIFYCDLCGAEMLNLHCKLICERCGYKRDCSDP